MIATSSQPGPTMAFNRTALSNLSLEDERYLNQQLSPQSRPMELFPTTKASDPLPGNWSYDSSIDLFSLNPAEMDPASFEFGDMTADSKDLFMDPFGTPTAISGFSMPTAEDNVSLSSDLDSDDQTWSMSTRPSIDMAMTPPTSIESSKPTTRVSLSNSITKTNARTSTSTSTSSTPWSSSPEITPQEYIPTRSDKRRKTRSLSNESSTSTTTSSAQAQAQASAPQDAQGRNAAKRAAHNIIEKRYRTNMNAKFLALEKAISPAGVQKSSRGSAGTGAGSLKKSEILSNALTYIERIQQENLAVQKELALLKQGLVSGGMWRASKQARS